MSDSVARLETRADARLRFWSRMALSAASGLLLSASMPNYDINWLGWFALVPLLAALATAPLRRHFVLALPFGLIWSVAVHNWYPHIFPPALGYFLIIAVGTFYAAVIQCGAWLQARLPGALRLLALPVIWSAIEFIKFVAPVVEDWWFVLLAKSQWRFPPALQVLSVTGFPGLSFLLMLANVALAFLVLHAIRSPDEQIAGSMRLPPIWASMTALAGVGAVVGWGALILPSSPPGETFRVAALTDMVNQDAIVVGASRADAEVGYLATSSAMSQAIFDVDAALTRELATASQPAFVVWPENEFAPVTDAEMMTQLGALATETGAYLVADVVSAASGQPVTDFSTADDLFDTAILIGPRGYEIGRRHKINITRGEASHGFVPGPHEYPVFDTPYGKVGLGVCWDRHRLYITRELARNGAKIVLMPVDDDFNANTKFPAYHASDSVFRAVENRVVFVNGTTNGLTVIVDPYGRIVSEGAVNERGFIVRETFTVPRSSLYTSWGDWFGWLVVVGAIALLGVAYTVGQKNT